MEENIIQLELPDLTSENNYMVKSRYISLTDIFFIYSAYYKSDIKSEDSNIWEENQITFKESKYLRKNLSSLEILYYRKGDVFGVSLEFMGVEYTFTTYFKEKKDAEKFYKTIDNWWIDGLK